MPLSTVKRLNINDQRGTKSSERESNGGRNDFIYAFVSRRTDVPKLFHEIFQYDLEGTEESVSQTTEIGGNLSQSDRRNRKMYFAKVSRRLS